MFILKAFFSGRAWLQDAGSCCRLAIEDIFSHLINDVFCGWGNILLMSIYTWWCILGCGNIFFECQFTLDYIFCCRRLFSRPTWLAAQVFLVSTMLIGRAAIFPFSFQLFSFHFCSFFSRGNLGRRMVEESTKIQDSDRFVKKHCLLSLFSFSTSFW